MQLTQKDKYRFWSKVDTKGPEECHNWKAGKTTRGYGNFTLDQSNLRAHRVAWELIYGAIPEDMYVLHKCDNPLCCNTEHLYIGTQANNLEDVRTRHPEQLGVNLHEGEIWLVRKLYREGKSFLSQREIAKMFKVSQSTIQRIVNSTNWLSKEGTYV